ncbi:hypothetical protein Droror1_Dr00001592 [Drosera rotundifolia]
MAAELIDLEIHINGDHIFFLNQRIISAYSIKLKKMIKQAKKNTQMRKTPIQCACGRNGSSIYPSIFGQNWTRIWLVQNGRRIEGNCWILILSSFCQK